MIGSGREAAGPASGASWSWLSVGIHSVPVLVAAALAFQLFVRPGLKTGGMAPAYAGRVIRCGAPVATVSAVDFALRWLSRHQNPDGSWGAANFTDQCIDAGCVGKGDSEYDVGLTGLALLAYLGAGYTHLSKDRHPDSRIPGRNLVIGEVVHDALQWLMSRQAADGCVGARGSKYMYNHAIAALALAEAYGMSSAPGFQEPAQRAIDFLVASQNPGCGWRYSRQSGDNDTSVTGWAVMALRSAELSDLDVPSPAAFEDALKWLNEATDPGDGYRAGYNSRGFSRGPPLYKPDSFQRHDSMTAVAVLCRMFMTKDKEDPALAGVRLLLSDLPVSKPDAKDYYYWYYGSLALYQYDGPAGSCWKGWNQSVKDALVPHQKSGKDGCANGSWTSEDERWGFEGGRVYATAINALTLEVYYRYPNVFRGSK